MPGDKVPTPYKHLKRLSTLTDFGKIVKEKDESVEHDVIIVGGGTAGCVLAARLSEDPNIRVLLIESGDSSANVLLSAMPMSCALMFHTDKDYNFYTVPQTNARSTARYWPRAKMLGGCSTINAMMFNYGAPSDYDEFSKALGEPLDTSPWSYQNFHKYFLKFERFVPHKDFPEVDASLRGSSGPVEIGYAGHYSPLTRQFLESCHSVGIQRVPDVNTAKGPLGATKAMTYIDSRGRRVTTQSSYLTPDVMHRPNLKIVLKATVTKILVEQKEGKPRAVGVQFVDNKNGAKCTALARAEVVLSAGSIHTPQILMLSGIGPSEHLRSFNIPVVVDLPGVGAHLMDHPVVDMNLLDKSRNSLAFVNPTLKTLININIFYFTAGLLQWMMKGKGPFTCNIGEGMAFVRSSDRTLFPEDESSTLPEDTTSGPDAPDIEIFCSPMGFLEHGTTVLPNSFALHGVLLRPTSFGSITLKSDSPFDAPVIDPKYLDTQHDIDVLVRALKIIRRIARSNPLAQSIDPEGLKERSFDHHLFDASDAELVKYVRERVQTLYHPTSTARMSSLEDGGVVDGRLRVYGVQGLRVVDASIFPTIVSGHTAAPVIAVAEQAADMIKEDLSIS